MLGLLGVLKLELHGILVSLSNSLLGEKWHSNPSNPNLKIKLHARIQRIVVWRSFSLKILKGVEISFV